MQLDIRIPHLPPPQVQKLRSEFRVWIDQIAARLELPAEAVEKIIVADESSYGPAIHEQDPQQEYTDSEFHCSAAKTIRKRTRERVSTVIILRDYVMGSVLKTTNHVRDMCVYIVVHEFGHCIDNARRPHDEDIPFPAGSKHSDKRGCRLCTFRAIRDR